MPPLPSVSGKEAVAAFERMGWIYARRESSHMYMKKHGVFGALAIPDHRTLAPGTLRSLIRSAGITVDQFIAALRDS